MLTDSTFSMLVMRTRFSGWEARRGDDNTRQMNPSLPSTRHYHIPHWYHRVTQCKRTGRDKQMEAKASRLAAASTCLMIMHALISVNAAVPWGLFHLWQFITVSSATDVPLTTPLALVINMIGRGPHIDRLKAGIARHRSTCHARSLSWKLRAVVKQIDKFQLHRHIIWRHYYISGVCGEFTDI